MKFNGKLREQFCLSGIQVQLLSLCMEKHQILNFNDGRRVTKACLKETLVLHHLLANGSSAVNGCRQNESPNS